MHTRAHVTARIAQVTVDVDKVKHELTLKTKGQLFDAPAHIMAHIRLLYTKSIIVQEGALWLKEFVDHSDVNGVSTQLVLWLAPRDCRQIVALPRV